MNCESRVSFRQNDNAFLERLRAHLEYGTLILGPKFPKCERGAMNLRRFPIQQLFERSCEMGLWRLTANKIAEIFGSRVTRKRKGKLNTTLEQVALRFPAP